MLAGAVVALLAKPLYAQPKVIEIPMYSIGSQTYYIDSIIKGAGKHSMLVDTGSGYSVINETTLSQLMQSGDAQYISKLK